MSPRLSFAILLLLLVVHLVSSKVFSKEYIQSRSMKIFNDSILVNNFECDNHRGFHDCDDFTVFKIYAHAAKFPSSGAGGYITDEPQFACSQVEPPENTSTEWAAIVYYSSLTCDCSYREKILNVQEAGYKIALLMEIDNCPDDIDINSTNITDITIPAVLLSKSLGAMLVNYSSPTDAEPIGSVIVRVHYADDYAIPMLIVVGCGGLLILTMIICLGCCQHMRKHKRKQGLIIEPYETLQEETKSKQSDDTDSIDTETEELPEFTNSLADHIKMPLQKVNMEKQHANKYGTVSRSPTQLSVDILEATIEIPSH